MKYINIIIKLLIFALFKSIIVMILWNYAIVNIFKVQELTLRTSFALVLLITTLAYTFKDTLNDDDKLSFSA